MKNISYYFILALSILIFSCRSKSASFEGGNAVAYMDAVDENIPPPPPPPPSANFRMDVAEPSRTGSAIFTDATAVQRKIIKDGSMEIKVKDLEKGKIQTDSLVKRFKGYYAEETFNKQDYSHDFSLKIRIPSEKFELFIAQAESAIGELVYKNVSSRDVTEEFIDLETRLKNKKNYLNRYSELLKQAKSVKDILEIEEKTRGIEEEIESSEGRMKYLNNQVDLSTLELRITKKNDYNFIPGNEGNFSDRLKLSLAKGWFGLVTFTLFVIRIWPFWIIVSLVYYLIRKILKKNKRK